MQDALPAAAPASGPPTLWHDWQWQQHNSIRSAQELQREFPGLPHEVVRTIEKNQSRRRFQITRYTLGLIRRTGDGLSPAEGDPIWQQVVPYWDTEGQAAYHYDGETENWELAHEMVTPIAQHKYDNRVIIRLANVCHSYCQFCYEALRTLEKTSPKDAYQVQHWRATLDYLRRHEEVEEAILSGGEPLMRSDSQIDSILGDLRGIGRWIAIRIHTRSLFFNPFRITNRLIDLLAQHEVNAVGLHVCHPNEITDEFRAAVRKLRQGVPILFANMPLLLGINDDPQVLHALCMGLYREGVVPHYLYHFLPFSPGAEQFRTSVQTGIDLIRSLKRHITNLAVPEFVIAHTSGKHTLPLLAPGEEPPRRGLDARGNPVVSYSNWRGELVEYLDVPDTPPQAAATSQGG